MITCNNKNLYNSKLFKTYWTFFFIFFFNLSCSKSDSNEPSNKTFKSVTVLAKENNEVYQINILNNGNELEIFNLTNDLGVDANNNFLRIAKPLLTFYQLGGFNYSVAQKNYISGETNSFDQICDLEIDESPNFPLNSLDKICLLTTKPNGCEPLNFIRILNKYTGSCDRIDLLNGYECSPGTSVMTYNETIFLTQKFESNHSILSSIDLTTLEVTGEITIDSNFKGTVNGNLLYIFSNNNLYIYNTENIQLLETRQFDSNLGGHSYGWFEAKFIENEMLIDLYYPQPSTIGKGPATIDLDSGEIVKGSNYFMFNLSQNLQDLFQASIDISSYDVDLSNGIILCSYTTGNAENKGGVVQTNFNGDVLNYIELDFSPYKVIIQ